MKLKKGARQHHFCPFTDNIPYTYEQESHHKVSTHPRSSPSFCQILSMILISCRVNMSCRRSDQIIFFKKTHYTLSIPYNKTKIQFFVWLYLTYFSRANKLGAVNAWYRPLLHSYWLLSFFFLSFLLGTCAKQPVSGPRPRNDLNNYNLVSHHIRTKLILSKDYHCAEEHNLSCEFVNDHVNQITLQVNK